MHAKIGKNSKVNKAEIERVISNLMCEHGHTRTCVMERVEDNGLLSVTHTLHIYTHKGALQRLWGWCIFKEIRVLECPSFLLFPFSSPNRPFPVFLLSMVLLIFFVYFESIKSKIAIINICLSLDIHWVSLILPEGGKA